MNPQFWNERYANPEYVYGKEPNQFLIEQLPGLKKGKILFAAEGEGRNAVYAASLGFDVSAFDQSEKAQEKALKLATNKGLPIHYFTSNIEHLSLLPESFDIIVLIYAHFPPKLRKLYHHKLLQYLKKDGVVLLEAFSKDQINFSSGGPKDIEMLYSKEELCIDFSLLKSIELDQKIIVLNEGAFHKGKASVLRLIGTK